MGGHDFYGKQVMRAATGPMFVDSGPIVVTDYGASGARIDGCIDGKVAVEIESRTAKQVRGAVLDFLCHLLQNKLLVLVPADNWSPPAPRPSAARSSEGLESRRRTSESLC